MTIALPARAKVNLDLHVTGRRSDGLHELQTRMQAVELHDLLEAERADETSLHVTGEMAVSVEGNTVLRAHEAVERAAGRKLPTRYALHKRIPPGSGLGGASSDAAAVLRAASALHGVKVDLQALAKEVGADVTFFLIGGTALAEGIGERITGEANDDGWFVIAWPRIELSTAEVYRAWDEVGGDGQNELRRAAAKVDARIDSFAARLGDGWRMTGSGSAFFTRYTARDLAEAATRKLDCWTAVTRAVAAWGS